MSDPATAIRSQTQTLLRVLRDARTMLAGHPPAPRIPSGATGFTPPVEPASYDEESAAGWGFADTEFVVRADDSVVLTGSRYDICGTELPNLLPWISNELDVPMGYATRRESEYPPKIPEPRRDTALEAALRAFLAEDQISDDPIVRLRHGHGHSGAEVYAVNYGSIPRLPDLVVHPRSHDEVVRIVDAAQCHGACVVPFGGGTNVTEALRLPLEETRVVIIVDLRQMNRILSVDVVNRTAHIEAGATGRHIAAELEKHGLTMGHEPDSLEFSTLGGWIATNASGMKKNRYGNIEDLVLDLTAVTARGVVSRSGVGPRESIGVNPARVMFGSEGNLGIVTSAVVKVSPLPEVQRYGSFVFPDLKTGLAFLYDVQRSGATPASVRLMDNTQFQLGQTLKPASHGRAAAAKSRLERLIVTGLKGFDPEKLSAATFVYEGSREEVDYQRRVVGRIAKRHRGLSAGAANGERGYQLTFSIAYIRDLTYQQDGIAESFETSVPWSRAHQIYDAVRHTVYEEHARRGLPGRPFFSGRFTQIYQSGVAVYFYLGFSAKGVEDPIGEYTAIEHLARKAILAAGGTLSHHHGVGKIRQHYLVDVYSEGARRCVQDIKAAVDPANLFGVGNQAMSDPVEGEVVTDHV